MSLRIPRIILPSPIRPSSSIGLLGREFQQPVALLIGNLPRHVHHVLANVAALRQLSVPAHRLEVSGVERAVEVVHLVARVVEVVLAGDAESGGVQHPGEHVAQDAAAGVADVNRPRGVDAHKLDLHALAIAAQRDVAECGALLQDGLHLRGQPARLQREVDEAGRLRPHACEGVAGGDERHQAVRDLERVHAQRARQPERQAGGVVAVLGARRVLHRHVDGRRGGQLPRRLRLGEGVCQQVTYEVHRNHGGYVIAAGTVWLGVGGGWEMIGWSGCWPTRGLLNERG